MFYLLLDGFNGGYGLDFGSDSNGDQYVGYIGGSITLPGSSYNNYQLRYDASADMVSLWVDGVEYANNIFTNQHETYLIDVEWGSVYNRGESALANWNLVSLEITPEPSTMALFGLGALILAARRFRGRH
jgi:hypothetical protein